MKKTNEIVIDSVHHVLVPDSNTPCKTICNDICSLRKECIGYGPYFCYDIMHDSYSHFEVKESLILRLLLFFITKRNIKNPF